MYATRTLASYIRQYNAENLTETVKAKVVCCMLDLTTAAIAGYGTPSALAVRRIGTELFGAGLSSVWFSGQTLNSIGAAFCNAAASSALDLDDGHRAARGHPGAAVIPTVLAIADPTCKTDEIITAVALGYEVGVRIAAAQNANTIGSRQSGRWAGYAAAAAAGRLSGVSPARLSHALAIAGVVAPNQDANGSSGYSCLTGNDVKEGIPWGVLTGMTALHLAPSGYTGPEDILDHASHFDTAAILDNLAEPRKILGTYFKPYSCCRYIHPAIDAFCDVKAQHQIVYTDIASVEVEIFAWALQLGNRCDPDSLTDIQYSLPYCIAIAAIDGVQALSPISDSLLRRPDLKNFASKVRLIVNSDIDDQFPDETLAKVTILNRKGERPASPVTTPKGDVNRPMLWTDVCQKFCVVTARKMSVTRQQMMLDAFQAFRDGDAAPLLLRLAEPLDR